MKVKKYFVLMLVIVLILTGTNVHADNGSWEIELVRNKLIINSEIYGGEYRILVIKGEDRKTYLLESEKEEIYLRDGDGEYNLSILKHKEKNIYRVMKKVKINVKDSVNEYIESGQPIYWENQEETLKLVRELTKDLKSDKDKFNVVYEYILKNIKYDSKKLETTKSRHIPEMDKVLEEKKGICFDYAVLLAGMLRSEGIPTKVVEGYRPEIDVYHAWNEVYIEGDWVVVDTTFDAAYWQAGVYKIGEVKKFTKVVEY